MVNINELYITPDNKRMIIDVSVRDDEYHENAYISEIVLDTQDTFVPEIGQPSSEWIAKRPVDAADYVAKIAWEVKKVDEYFDIIYHHRPCVLHHHHHHHHHSHCGCHPHKDVCFDRTKGTGHYANPYEVVKVDLSNGTAIDQFGQIIRLKEGDFLKLVQHTIIGEETIDYLEDASYSDNNLTITSNAESTTPDTIEDANYENNELIITANAENSDDTVYVYKNDKLEIVPEVLDKTKVKHARIEIRQEDLCRPFEDTMFFVWVKCEGVAPEAPCALNKTYTLGVCVNYFNIYRRFICLMRELLDDCEIPKHFIDLWMRWKAVQMAIATGNYLEAVLLWKRFFLFKHQRPLYEQPQYMRFWANWHKDGILPEANYAHPVYGFGGSLFNFTGGSCRTCRR